MRSANTHRKRFGMLGASVLLLAALATAKDGRDFAGFYALSGATDLDTEVRLTLTVWVHNYSDADVADATITLEDSTLPETSYGSFTYVSVRNRESVRLSGELTVAKREYQQWQNGGTPRLRITYTDTNGKAAERPIELAPALAEEE